MRKLQHVAKILFILIAVQPPHRAAAMSRDVRMFHFQDCRGELFHQVGAPLWREQFGVGRHLANFHAIVNANPTAADRTVVQIERKRGEIESALGKCFVMAPQAGSIDKRFEFRRKGWLQRQCA